MTTRQRQNLLQYLGYYNGIPDDVYGPKTKQAVEDFQKDFGGIGVDGVACKETDEAMLHAVAYGMPAKKAETTTVTGGDFWGEIKYFVRDEFRCTCGGKYCNGFTVEPDEKLVRILDKIRGHFGKPFTPNSAIRCKQRNSEVGGVSNSQHLYGIAADISVPGVAPKDVAAYAETLLPNTGGIGIYSWGIHIDTRSTKSRWNG